MLGHVFAAGLSQKFCMVASTVRRCSGSYWNEQTLRVVLHEESSPPCDNSKRGDINGPLTCFVRVRVCSPVQSCVRVCVCVRVLKWLRGCVHVCVQLETFSSYGSRWSSIVKWNSHWKDGSGFGLHLRPLQSCGMWSHSHLLAHGIPRCWNQFAFCVGCRNGSISAFCLCACFFAYSFDHLLASLYVSMLVS